eukprot:10533980-Ditylum_brightwellii.AAC.1
MYSGGRDACLWLSRAKCVQLTLNCDWRIEMITTQALVPFVIERERNVKSSASCKMMVLIQYTAVTDKLLWHSTCLLCNIELCPWHNCQVPVVLLSLAQDIGRWRQKVM